MVQLVGDDCVFGVQNGFEKAAIGVKARAVEDGIFGAQKFAQPRLQLLMNGLRAADEANAGQTVAPLVERSPGGLDHARMVGQAQVIVGAEIQYRQAGGDFDLRLLRAIDEPFALEQSGLGDLFDPAG